MALRASMRRDQRRRLLASRNRAAGEAAIAPAEPAGGGRAASYDDAARPERHPALATRLPVGRGRFLLAAAGIVLAFAGAIALGVAGPLFGRRLLPEGGRFARSLAVLAGGFDPRAAVPIQVWLAELALLLAAAVAGSVRFMRRHRCDDYKGRFRAWGWLAAMLSVAAWAGAVPLGPLVAAVASDATGIAAGPAGIGWWVGLAAVGFAIVIPWAVLPLRERAATAFWITLALAAWAAAAASPWAGDLLGGGGRAAVIGQSCWAAGAGLMLIAMLAAARSVIREVRGQAVAAPARRPRREREAVGEEPAAEPNPQDDELPMSDDPDAESWDAAEVSEPEAGTAEFVDGSEQGQRRLSKAERKRLRKLARMNGQAA